jgi:hypothetical protein
MPERVHETQLVVLTAQGRLPALRVKDEAYEGWRIQRFVEAHRLLRQLGRKRLTAQDMALLAEREILKPVGHAGAVLWHPWQRRPAR